MGSHQLVCVTGASGFIAAHIVEQLLKQGYRVKGTVRSLAKPEKYRYLSEMPGADSLELLEAQLLTPGDYHSAVADCQYVIHCASPYSLNVKDPQKDLLDPAVNGTLNVLQACSDSPSVQRVVLTSSIAAITDEPENNKTFTEEDWNHKSSLQRNPYYYSKMSAERAAWDFMQQNKPAFEMVAVNPFLVIGPSHSAPLNTSNQLLRDMLSGVFPGILTLNWGVVDVRDVAKAHISALENQQAEGRYLCANQAVDMREMVEMLKSLGYQQYKLPKRDMSGKFGEILVKILSYAQKKGSGTYLRTNIGKVMRFDNAKIRRELGMEFIPVLNTLRDTVEDLIRWGHLK